MTAPEPISRLNVHNGQDASQFASFSGSDTKADTLPTANLMVCYAGTVPVRFNQNACGFMYELTSAENATRFADESAATQAAARAKLQNYSIQPVLPS